MIPCVKFSEIEAHLEAIGFDRIEETEESFAYERGSETLFIRKPNSNGDLPESLMNRAFEAAGLDPPVLDTFWCD